jgi:hypothetical protein
VSTPSTRQSVHGGPWTKITSVVHSPSALGLPGFSFEKYFGFLLNSENLH